MNTIKYEALTGLHNKCNDRFTLIEFGMEFLEDFWETLFRNLLK